VGPVDARASAALFFHYSIHSRSSNLALCQYGARGWKSAEASISVRISSDLVYVIVVSVGNEISDIPVVNAAKGLGTVSTTIVLSRSLELCDLIGGLNTEWRRRRAN